MRRVQNHEYFLNNIGLDTKNLLLLSSVAMELEAEYHYDSDSGNESSDDDVGLEFDSEGEAAGSANRFNKDNEEWQYEVLSTEDISRHMLDCIKEFNNVANVSHSQIKIGIHYDNDYRVMSKLSNNTCH